MCGVSRKQLRYYEERGILSEVPRNEENNYRYYTQEHIYQIVAAKTLRGLNIPVKTINDIIYGKDIGNLQGLLQRQLAMARDALEASIRQYEQSSLVYTKLTEALSYLKISKFSDELSYEIVERPVQKVVSIRYTSTWEDETYCDLEHLPQIQTIAQEVNCASLGTVTYVTYGHFDSKKCSFNHEVHDYKIAIPVIDMEKPSRYYDTIPSIKGVSTIHVGSPKDKHLLNTYLKLLHWARDRGYKLGNWSVEEWLISPMITNNKNLWVIQIIIPLEK